MAENLSFLSLSSYFFPQIEQLKNRKAQLMQRECYINLLAENRKFSQTPSHLVPSLEVTPLGM